MRFAWMTVGLLAMVGLSACGVGGVDDPEGQQAVSESAQSGTAGQNQQALASGPEGCPAPNPGDVSTAGSSGPVNPTLSSLPSDPVPWKRPVDDQPIPGPGGMPPAYGNR